MFYLRAEEDPGQLMHRAEDGRQEEEKVNLPLVRSKLANLVEDVIEEDTRPLVLSGSSILVQLGSMLLNIFAVTYDAKTKG